MRHEWQLHPTFLDLRRRPVVVVGAGPVGASKAIALVDCGALVTVVAPEAVDAIRSAAAGERLRWVPRSFEAADLDGAWLVVAATADPVVNRSVAIAAEARRVFVNAVDDRANASCYAGAVVRRGPMSVVVSSGGRAPALSRLLRELLENLLPDDSTIEGWVERADALRRSWQAQKTPMGVRYEMLVQALAKTAGSAKVTGTCPKVA